MVNLIERFMKQYSREYDFYQELSRLAASRMEDKLTEQGIKAIVTYRPKKHERLHDKLNKRNEKKPYKSREEIIKDIVDFAGVRVSLYFPSARNAVDDLVCKAFNVHKKKEFPDSAHQPKPYKRFSGYWATHYRVTLKDGVTARYLDTPIEIQVASVLMLAWAEVEHDLVYKPASGSLSKTELAILDEINGLVLAGEIALERLQEAISERIAKNKKITNKYDLTSFLLSSIQNNLSKNAKLGDILPLGTYLTLFNSINTDQLSRHMKDINFQSSDSVADQVIFKLFDENYGKNKDNMTQYFLKVAQSQRKATAFEKFIRCWIILERAQTALLREKGKSHHTARTVDPTALKELAKISETQASELALLRKTRNEILHGIEPPRDEILKEKFRCLKEITKAIIDSLADEKMRQQLSKELEEI
jgi:ppGpp synthetase/RelA/SpoT-type nucleotidyltranferase